MSSMLRRQFQIAAGGLSRTFWLLCAGMFVNRAGSFVLIYLSVYLTHVRGFSIETAGVVVALYGAGGVTASLIGGHLADHIGRRRTMIGSLVLGGSSIVALGYVHDLHVLAPMVFLAALTGEAYRPAMQAAVSDLVPAADRVRAFGLLYWVVNVGFSMGAVLGGMLATRSFLGLFIGDGLTSVLFGLLVAAGVPETRPVAPAHWPGHPPRRALLDTLAPFLDGAFGVFVLLSVLILMIFMQHVTTLPIDITARGVPRAWLGAILGINGISIALLQPFLAPPLQARNRSNVLAAGALMVGAGFGLNALARGPGLYALSVLIWSVGELHLFPIANALVADVAPARLRGRYQGAYGLAFGMAALTAPLLGTAVMQRYGSIALWIGCLALGLAVASGHLLLRPALTRLREARIRSRDLEVVPG